MSFGRSFTGKSSRGSVVEALTNAVAAATQGLKAERFNYTLKEIVGTVGRATGTHELAITIDAEAASPVAGSPVPAGSRQERG